MHLNATQLSGVVCPELESLPQNKSKSLSERILIIGETNIINTS